MFFFYLIIIIIIIVLYKIEFYRLTKLQQTSAFLHKLNLKIRHDFTESCILLLNSYGFFFLRFIFARKHSNKEKGVSASCCGNKPSVLARRQNMYCKAERLAYTPHPRDAAVMLLRRCYNTASYRSLMS